MFISVCRTTGGADYFCNVCLDSFLSIFLDFIGSLYAIFSNYYQITVSYRLNFPLHCKVSKTIETAM